MRTEGDEPLSVCLSGRVVSSRDGIDPLCCTALGHCAVELSSLSPVHPSTLTRIAVGWECGGMGGDGSDPPSAAG